MAFDLHAVIDDYGLSGYGSNAIALLAIALRFDIDDLALVASQAVTDCGSDKKCDLIYIDDVSRTAIVAQAYSAQDPAKQQAPANKAGDLNTAIGWALSRDIQDVPAEIRSQVHEVRDGLETGRLQNIEFWYIHNLGESQSADDELATVRESAKNALHTRFKDVLCNVGVLQVGSPTLERWWKALQADVGIENTVTVPITGAFVENGIGWSATVASIPAQWLYEMFKEYGTDLFKGNVRDYLGLRDADANINRGIRETVEREPGQLFVYNNGLSIITRGVTLSEDNRSLEADGLSIVNGAQTTGSIGAADEPPSSDARVLARFIAVDERGLVQQIIRFNNSQNKVEAADFRSGDETQTRLRAEFSAQYGALRYLGGRRGGVSDEIRRNRKSAQLLDSTEVAKSLAAFHGMPTVAYNRVNDLWTNENYTRIFPRDIVTARHIVFVYGLYRAIAAQKDRLRNTPEAERTVSGKEQLGLLKSTSAYFILMAGIGQAIETLVAHAVPSSYELTFGLISDFDEVVRLWGGVVSASIPFLRKFKAVIEDGLKNEADVKESLNEFTSSLEALAESLADQLRDFRIHVDCQAALRPGGG